MRFSAQVELGGRTATGIEVPAEVIASLGAGQRPAVTVTIGTYTYRTTATRMGGRFLVPLSAENRTAAGVAAGDDIDVDIELDTAPRVVEMPEDLAMALGGVEGARERFDALSFTHRKEWVRSIEDAKRPQTREARIAKAVEAMTVPS